MFRILLLTSVEGLPYEPGDIFIADEGRFGLVWHVWKTIVRLPEGSYEVIERC